MNKALYARLAVAPTVQVLLEEQHFSLKVCMRVRMVFMALLTRLMRHVSRFLRQCWYVGTCRVS